MKKTVLVRSADQRNAWLRRWRSLLLVSGLMFGWLTLGCHWLSITKGNAFELLAFLSGMLATVVFLLWLALLVTARFRREQTVSSDHVLAALRATLAGPRKDPNARVRAEAAKGLAVVDVEQSALHHEHQALDALLIATLAGPQKDTDAAVRFEVAKGLTALELEQQSYHHSHQALDDVIFEHDL